MQKLGAPGHKLSAQFEWLSRHGGPRGGNAPQPSWRDIAQQDLMAEQVPWPATCYASTRDGPNDLEGDVSPEEARYVGVGALHHADLKLTVICTKATTLHDSLKLALQAACLKYCCSHCMIACKPRPAALAAVVAVTVSAQLR